MPRRSRQKSETGIYHVVLRGSNRQDIFHDDSDRIRYLEILKKYKVNHAYKVHGWCLMDSHIHLLLQEDGLELAEIMKRTGVSYVWHYNRKYNVTGHLFQDRYKSEVVEEDAYLLTVIRYIHQNPVKAGLVKKPADWKWSSCLGYYGNHAYPPELLDRDLILGMFSKDENSAVKSFEKFNETKNTDTCLEFAGVARLTDTKAKEEISKAVTPLKIMDIKTMPKKQRDEALSRIKKVDGITQRQAARILGISPNLIFKAK